MEEISQSNEQQNNEKWIKYREQFIQEYGYNKQMLLQTIKQGLLECNTKQLKETLKLMYFDNDKTKQEILNGNLILDLRCLHCETIFHIWVYLKECEFDQSICALEIRKNLIIN